MSTLDQVHQDTLYRELYEGAPVAIHVSRPDGSLITCNLAFAQLLGFASIEEALSTDMTGIYSSPDRRQQWVDYIRLHKRIDHVRGRVKSRDGRLLRVIFSAVGQFDARGQLAEIRGYIIDATKRAEMEDELKEREQRLKSVFHGAADAMIILDDQRRIVEANQAASALFGMTLTNLANCVFDDLVIDGGAQLPAAWRELLAVGEAQREHRVVSHGRSPRLAECSYRAAVHADRHLCIARDVTDRRMLEERLVQAEKSESVGRLAGGIAHDFNNLLTAILGYTELLLASRGPADPERVDLEEIQRAGQRAAGLTQQLLAYSRKQVLLPRTVDLNQTVEHLRTTLPRLLPENITLSCDVSPAPALITIDPTQLDQAILNLVLNSRDALPDGGDIRLEVSRVRARDADLPPYLSTRATEFVTLRVVDNGVGMPPAVRTHLFEPFFTTKDIGKGTGLGLASVHGIVRQSEGFITVQSEPGNGTALTMHFPAAGAVALPEQSGVGPAQSPTGDPATILLVEEDDAKRAITSTGLRRQGYEVIEASTPRGAHQIFEHQAGRIDLLLTDMALPGMNGPTLAQRLVDRKADLSVVFMSDRADLEPPLEAGSSNVSFLYRPFGVPALVEKVRDALSRRQKTT